MTCAKDLFKKENVFSPNEAYDVAPFEDKEDVANTPMFVKVSDLRSWFLEKSKEINKKVKYLLFENSLSDLEFKRLWDKEQARAFREIVEALKSEDAPQGIEAIKELKK